MNDHIPEVKYDSKFSSEEAKEVFDRISEIYLEIVNRYLNISSEDQQTLSSCTGALLPLSTAHGKTLEEAGVSEEEMTTLMRRVIGFSALFENTGVEAFLVAPSDKKEAKRMNRDLTEKLLAVKTVNDLARIFDYIDQK